MTKDAMTTMWREPPYGLTRCHVCDHGLMEMVEGFGKLTRVTSDCQTWPRGGRLAVCASCGTVQKPVDRAWQDEADRIYRAYAIYHQSGGVEQAVFEQGTGRADPRSRRLLTQLMRHHTPPRRGRLLDIGCGNGALLRAASELMPDWSLHGSEINDRYQDTVQSIAGVEAMHTCALDNIPGQFDVITLVHVLEHIVSPATFLQNVREKLSPTGVLLVEVPDHQRNPFELLIADHCSHFSPATIVQPLVHAGLNVVVNTRDWVAKELSVLATSRDKSCEMAGGAAGQSTFSASCTQSMHHVADAVNWLHQCLDHARQLASNRGTLGLFGTSIASTWMNSELHDCVRFFVDEDPTRAGTTYLGCPVYRPADIPFDADVLLALPHWLAEQVAQRLRRPGVRYHLPPVHGNAMAVSA